MKEKFDPTVAEQTLTTFTPLQLLKTHFGYSQFRAGQLEIINSVLSNNDTLAILPTGGGKSICFQIPGLMLTGITLVVSPLISLMKDQVDSLQHKNISATYINSTLSKTEITTRFANLAQGKYRFVYVAPERLKTKEWLAVCQDINITLIAIDEAHCISMWGHDFRPSYMDIAAFINQLKLKPKVAAFTATATPLVQTDIVESLKLSHPDVFLHSFRRTNLKLHVIDTPSTLAKEIALFRLLRLHHNQPGIIYASTQRETDRLVQLIHHYNGLKISVASYHGGQSSEERAKTQERFLSNQVQIITATNAFGMGVDKSNVRFVIHYQIPGTIENYYQEAGRAGRDRQLSDCYLLFHPPDIQIQGQFIDHAHVQPDDPQREYCYYQLQKMVEYTQKPQCRQQYILQYFGETLNHPCHQCDFCRCWQLVPSAPEKQLYKKLWQYFPSIAQPVRRLIALHQPRSQSEYLRIPGIGQGWIDQWYNDVSQLLEKENLLCQ